MASSIMAFSPTAYGKTISVGQSITNVKNDMNKAASQYVFPALEGKLSPSDTYLSERKNSLHPKL
ncbi:hypothetical protein MKZ20_04470 [Psychrobacillus sp. FSL K6-2684]|uniref:Uncharacterized protein n=1 Tax=Psychrobacillus faecigallinarum TaxID=2762235 RepID=A0ABR8R5X0_9BACI|nr:MULTISPECIES: hypothetical protein [Psychrobacillus]MBD7943187.1 hypothetical protein [Psychrobacillus faecigallinarum]